MRVRARSSGAGVVVSRSMPQRNDVSVLPEPVGARISVWAPEAIAGQPRSWAGVGSGNEVSNQARTGGEKRSSALIRSTYRPPRRPPPRALGAGGRAGPGRRASDQAVVAGASVEAGSATTIRPFMYGWGSQMKP